jgi:hypothetical protein
MADVRAANEVQVRGRYNATPPTLADQDTQELQLDTNGNLKVNVVVGGGAVASAVYIQGTDAISTSNVAIKRVSGAAALEVTDTNVRRLLEKLVLLMSEGDGIGISEGRKEDVREGYSTYRVLSAATTNADQIKSSNAKVHGWFIFNTSASVKYVKLFNTKIAPVLGTDRPLLTIPVPAGGGANVEFANGIDFTVGIGIAITGAAGDLDTTAVAANDVIANIFYRSI